MRAWIKPYFLREAKSKMFLSPWRISLAERQDAYFVGLMIVDYPAISFVARSVDKYWEGLHQGYGGTGQE